MKVERDLGWNRVTVGKGIKELTTGITGVDNYRGRGRKKEAEHLPNFLEDIKKLVDSQGKIDPSFKSQRLYTHLERAKVRTYAFTTSTGCTYRGNSKSEVSLQ